jgi:hypothetical protein
VGLKINGTHPLLAYGYDVNLMGKHRNLSNDSEEVGLEINIRKPKNILLSHYKHAVKFMTHK